MGLGNPAAFWPAYPITIQTISELGPLPDGWNGHRAARITQESQRAAITFLTRVWNEFGSSVPEPTVVAPTSDGGVAVEWIVKDGGAVRGVEIVFIDNRNEFSVRNRDTRVLERDGENVDARYLLFEVIKPHVAGHFVKPPTVFPH